MDKVSYPCGVPNLTGMEITLFDPDNDSVAIDTQTLAEDTNRPGWYSAEFDIVSLDIESAVYAFLITKDDVSVDDYQFAALTGSSDTELVRDRILLIIPDPLMREVPDDYPTGTAGYALGHMAEDIVSALTRAASGTYQPIVGDLISLTYGDDYYESDNRAISKTVTDDSLPDWADEDTAAYRFTLNAVSVTIPATIVNRTGSSRTIKCDASRVDLAPLGWGNKGFYEIIITRVQEDLDDNRYTTIVDDSPFMITP